MLDLLQSTETYRVEKTTSTTNIDKFSEAICAFANDMSGTGLNGYLLIGVKDDGSRSGLKVNDELLKRFSAIRSDGNILPFPKMNVDSFSFVDGDVLVVEVVPCDMPPVRYRGRTFIRIGPRKDLATHEEEELLIERRGGRFLTFDTTPCQEATIDDIDTRLFSMQYLPYAVDEETLRNDTRSIKQQMASLRLFDLKKDCPTYAAIIMFGKNPKYFLFGDYVQYVYFNGKDEGADILNQYAFQGNLATILPKIDTFVETALIQQYPVPVSALREKIVRNFPKWALRELVMNAIMHRDYRGNAPIKLYQFPNRIEITNPGGLYGKARPENFPNENDYRNPIVAECMRTLGYVNMFNHGIKRVQQELIENGNGEAIFSVDRITVFSAIVKGDSLRDSNGFVLEIPDDKVNLQQNDNIDHVTENVTVNVTENVTEKRRQNILQLIRTNTAISTSEIAKRIGVARMTIHRDIEKLKQAGLLTRIGPDKGGWWKVTETDDEQKEL